MLNILHYMRAIGQSSVVRLLRCSAFFVEQQSTDRRSHFAWYPAKYEEYENKECCRGDREQESGERRGFPVCVPVPKGDARDCCGKCGPPRRPKNVGSHPEILADDARHNNRQN